MRGREQLTQLVNSLMAAVELARPQFGPLGGVWLKARVSSFIISVLASSRKCTELSSCHAIDQRQSKSQVSMTMGHITYFPFFTRPPIHQIHLIIIRFLLLRRKRICSCKQKLNLSRFVVYWKVG